MKKIIPDALKKGYTEIQTDNSSSEPGTKLKQLQGKTKTKMLLHELILQQKSMNDLEIKRNCDGADLNTEQKKMKTSLTDTKKQFKMERIKSKLEVVKRKAHNVPAPNVYQMSHR